MSLFLLIIPFAILLRYYIATEIANRLSAPRASADEIRNMVIDRKKREMYEKRNKLKYSNEVKKGQNVNHMYKGETDV
jgi:hypothetical protein